MVDRGIAGELDLVALVLVGGENAKPDTSSVSWASFSKSRPAAKNHSRSLSDVAPEGGL